AYDVPVAAQYVFPAAGEPLVENPAQLLHRLELELLALFAGRAGRHVKRYHTQIPETRFDIAALVVERFPADRPEHFVGLALRVDRDAAVAFLRRRVAVEAMVAVRTECRAAQLCFLRLGFLQADHV